MRKHRTPYPAEFRAQIVELVKSGRTPEELSREFEPTAQTIINWVAQADRQECDGGGKVHARFSIKSRRRIILVTLLHRQS